MQVAEGCRYQALTAVLLEPLQSAYVRATAVSHVRGADTPSRRVVAQEGSRGLRAPDLVDIQPVARRSFSVVASQQLC